jgi:hypothetical protein
VVEVNGCPFHNNVSLGSYGDAVQQPTYRDAMARTRVETAAHVLGPGAAAVDLQLVDERGRSNRNRAHASSGSSSSTKREPVGLRNGRGPRRMSK